MPAAHPPIVAEERHHALQGAQQIRASPQMSSGEAGAGQAAPPGSLSVAAAERRWRLHDGWTFVSLIARSGLMIAGTCVAVGDRKADVDQPVAQGIGIHASE